MTLMPLEMWRDLKGFAPHLGHPVCLDFPVKNQAGYSLGWISRNKSPPVPRVGLWYWGQHISRLVSSREGLETAWQLLRWRSWSCQQFSAVTKQIFNKCIKDLSFFFIPPHLFPLCPWNLGKLRHIWVMGTSCCVEEHHQLGDISVSWCHNPLGLMHQDGYICWYFLPVCPWGGFSTAWWGREDGQMD